MFGVQITIYTLKNAILVDLDLDGDVNNADQP